jgi:hypothetical protein
MSPIGQIYKSLLRYVSDIIPELASTTNDTVTYHSWEARGEEDKFPKNTLIGLDGFNFDENNGLWIVRFSVGLSTYQDVNLMKEIEAIDFLFDKFHEGVQIPIRDRDTGEEFTVMVSTQFEVAPMVQTLLRNYRTLLVELKKTAN